MFLNEVVQQRDTGHERFSNSHDLNSATFTDTPSTATGSSTSSHQQTLPPTNSVTQMAANQAVTVEGQMDDSPSGSDLEDFYSRKDFHTLNHSFAGSPDKIMGEASDPLWVNLDGNRRGNHLSSSSRRGRFKLSNPSSDKIADDSILNASLQSIQLPPSIAAVNSHFHVDGVPLMDGTNMAANPFTANAQLLSFAGDHQPMRPFGPDGHPIKIEISDREQGPYDFDDIVDQPSPYHHGGKVQPSVIFGDPYIKQESLEDRNKGDDSDDETGFPQGQGKLRVHRRQTSQSCDDMYMFGMLAARERQDAASIDSGFGGSQASNEDLPLSPSSVLSNLSEESFGNQSNYSLTSDGSAHINLAPLRIHSPTHSPPPAMPQAPSAQAQQNQGTSAHSSSSHSSQRIRAFSMDDAKMGKENHSSSGGAYHRVRRRDNISTTSVVFTSPPGGPQSPPTKQPIDHQENAPFKKHKKQGIVCANCHKSKTKCCGGRPCKRCVRLGREGTCIDRIFRKKGRPKKTSVSSTGARSASSSPPPQAQAVPELVARFLALHGDVIRNMSDYLMFFHSLIEDRLGRYREQLMHLLPKFEGKIPKFRFEYSLMDTANTYGSSGPRTQLTQLSTDGNLHLTESKPILHQMPVAVIKIELHRIAKYHYRFSLLFNDEFVDLFGMSREAALHKFANDSIPFLMNQVHESDWKNQLSFLRDFLQGVRDQSNFVSRCLTRSGKFKRCLLSYRFFRNDSGTRFKSGIICCTPLDEATSAKITANNRARGALKVSRKSRSKKQSAQSPPSAQSPRAQSPQKGALSS